MTVPRSSADVVVVDVLVNALAEAMAPVLPAVAVSDVSADKDEGVLTVIVTVLAFTMSTPLEEEFGC